MPVCRENMPTEVNEILAEMDAHNKEFRNARKLVQVRSWSLGEPDGELVSDYWQVTIYDRLVEAFYIYKLHYYWEFDLTKCDRTFITISRDDMLVFLGDAIAFTKERNKNTEGN
jgi:hypothetical protein